MDVPSVKHRNAGPLMSGEGAAIFSAHAYLPLSAEGVWIRVQERDDPYFAHMGKMLFVPKDEMLIVPGTALHAGGLRAGVSGNPVLALTLFFLPSAGQITAQQATPGGNLYDPKFNEDERGYRGRHNCIRGGRDGSFSIVPREGSNALKDLWSEVIFDIWRLFSH